MKKHLYVTENIRHLGTSESRKFPVFRTIPSEGVRNELIFCKKNLTKIQYLGLFLKDFFRVNFAK